MLTPEEHIELKELMKKLQSIDKTLSQINKEKEVVLIRLEELTTKMRNKS